MRYSSQQYQTNPTRNAERLRGMTSIREAHEFILISFFSFARMVAEAAQPKSKQNRAHAHAMAKAKREEAIRILKEEEEKKEKASVPV